MWNKKFSTYPQPLQSTTNNINLMFIKYSGGQCGEIILKKQV